LYVLEVLLVDSRRGFLFDFHQSSEVLSKQASGNKVLQYSIKVYRHPSGRQSGGVIDNPS